MIVSSASTIIRSGAAPGFLVVSFDGTAIPVVSCFKKDCLLPWNTGPRQPFLGGQS
jgi:hypothetical protein